MDKEKFIDMCFDVLILDFHKKGREVTLYDFFEVLYERMAKDDGKMQNF